MQSRTRRMLDMCTNREDEDIINNDFEKRDTNISESNIPSTSSRKSPVSPHLEDAFFEPFEESSTDFVPSEESTSEEDSSSDRMLVKKRVKIPTQKEKTIEHVTAELIATEEVNEQKEKKSRGRKKRDGPGSRKRLLQPKSWDKNIRKTLKTQGAQYLTSKGKTVVAKQLKDPCQCRRKCFEKFSLEERKAIFTGFYNLSSEAQNQFIANSIEEQPKSGERLRREKNSESRRRYTRKYYLIKDSNKMEVCQIMFTNTLVLTLKRIRVLIEKKRNTVSGICPEDGRGKHNNHPKTPEQDKEEIRLHIKMFPTYESHYSRSHTKKCYLPPDLSISKMYKLYVEHCREKNVAPRNEALYRKIFVEEFNLSFHKPANDTCGTCDKLEHLLKSAKDDQKEAIENQKKEHLELADSVYAEKKSDRLSCKSNPNEVVVSFDLQKCLPTPHLRSGISFYKRKLWTLNLTIFESREEKNSAICYLWDETIANRGGLEIASCLFSYLRSLPQHITKIVLYSDCCPGQNKNIYISLMFLMIVEEFMKSGRTETTITHKFLVPGHTHMEADTIHAAIEKTKKTTTANIDIPRDWANLIRLVPRNPPIVVNEMQQHQFLNFKSLLHGHFQHRKVNTRGEPVQWKLIRMIQYRCDSPGLMFYKHTCDPEEQFQVLDLKRKNTRKSKLPKLAPISNKPLGIPQNKHQHLKDLLPFIGESSRPYYEKFLNTLSVSPDATDTITDDEEDEDMEY